MIDFYINENIFEIDDLTEEEKEIEKLISRYYLSPPAEIEKIIIKKIASK